MSVTGKMEVTELPPIEASQHPTAAQIVERLLYRWSPPADLVQKLPAGYTVALECWRCRDGFRRFTPANPREKSFADYTFYDATAFTIEAAVGGRALLWYRGEPAPYPWLTYESARLFFQYSQHLREHLGPTRKLANALNLCLGARQTDGERDILPADIGLNAMGDGERWTVSRLKEEGQAAARQRGIEMPSSDEIVRLGLLAAAKLNPLEMSDAQSELIARSVIFRLDSDLPNPHNDLVEIVALHVQKSIKKKHDVSNEEFRRWIEDPKSSLIRSIERANKGLDRKQIRAALLELAWLSVKLLGKSVDVLMRDVRDSIAELLGPEENFLYEQTYLANPVFGGLPFVLLHDRMTFLNEVIPEFWMSSNDEQSVKRIRTMLYYYGIIVGNLRDSDARVKRHAHVNSVTISSFAEDDWLDQQSAVATQPMMERLHDIIHNVGVTRGVIPSHNADKWSASIISWDEVTVIVEVCNPTNKKVQTMVISRSTLDGLVKDVLFD